jgi:hypothetical protein
MTEILELNIHFAAAALSEALARRGQAEPYSAGAEIARLAGELAFGGKERRGLDPSGAAVAARALLEERLGAEPRSPLARVVSGLELGRTERDLLSLLLAWALEPRIGLLFGHVHDSLQRTRPTVGAVTEVLADPVGVLVALGAASALRRHGVVEVDQSGPDGSLSIDARMVQYLASGELAPLDTPAGRLSRAAATASDQSGLDA